MLTPGFARHPRPQLPAGRSAQQLALPWGDSAYTTFVAARWLLGDPFAAPAAPLNWQCGPPPNGLTPSSEGPRRAYQARWRARVAAFDGSLGLVPGDRVGMVDRYGTTHIGVIERNTPAEAGRWDLRVSWLSEFDNQKKNQKKNRNDNQKKNRNDN